MLDSKRIKENDIIEINNMYKDWIQNDKKKELELVAIFASSLKEKEYYLSDCPIVENGKIIDPKPDAVKIELKTKESLYPYELWFVYKDSENTFYYSSTGEFQFKSDSYWNGVSETFVTNNKTYNSLEETKKAIEDYISEFDNVKLEEIEIPEALK